MQGHRQRSLHNKNWNTVSTPMPNSLSVFSHKTKQQNLLHRGMYEQLYDSVSEANTVENVMPVRMCVYLCDKLQLILKLNMTFQEVPNCFEFLRPKNRKNGNRRK